MAVGRPWPNLRSNVWLLSVLLDWEACSAGWMSVCTDWAGALELKELLEALRASFGRGVLDLFKLISEFPAVVLFISEGGLSTPKN